ncbi:MAG: hypothetical protein MUC38_03600 [Cyclobacteriaceae bacterium]|jgi:hypothetical protein|nr:hypothetical protein [Cyclobacteriaceae bacterium]
MPVTEIRSEINSTLDRIPPEMLPEVLTWLREAEKSGTWTVRTVNQVKAIFEEDKELLTRLSQ